MNDTPGTFELREPVKPEALVPDSWVEPWMLVAGGLLLAAILAVLILKKKKPVPEDPAAVRNAARNEAASALQSIAPQSLPREAAVQASLILRRYLATAAGDPALFETHEEFLSRHESLKDFSDEARESTALGFARLAAMKYAERPPELATEQVIGGSLSLLEILHQGFRK